MNKLAKRMWAGSKGPPEFWETPGVRTDACILDQPRVLISEVNFQSFFLPVRTPTSDISMSKLKMAGREAQAVFKYLAEACNGCGWFKGSPEISILAISEQVTDAGGVSRNVLADPGKEHLHVLPIDEDQLIGWIDDGSVARGRVNLVDTKGDIRPCTPSASNVN